MATSRRRVLAGVLEGHPAGHRESGDARILPVAKTDNSALRRTVDAAIGLPHRLDAMTDLGKVYRINSSVRR